MRVFCLLLLLSVHGFAGWGLERTEVQPVADGVTCRALVFRNGGETLRAHWVAWDRRHTLRVIDLAPDESVAEGARRAGALAAVNGGYFHADRRPLGLVISGGETLHRWDASRLLTGVLAVAQSGDAKIFRNAQFQQNAPWREALQAGPFLVDRGRSVPGLNAAKAAERTVVVAGKSGALALVVTGPVTLAQLGELLAEPGLWPEKIERALNLDGGSSTALWLADGASPRKEWKHVRNALGVVAK